VVVGFITGITDEPMTARIESIHSTRVECNERRIVLRTTSIATALQPGEVAICTESSGAFITPAVDLDADILDPPR
jgi:hypothetical protein